MAIPFTQYMRPAGKAVAVKVARPEHIEKLASELIAAGCKFEAEVLTTGEVSFTCEHDDHPQTIITIEVVENGPAVLDAVDRLIENAHKLWIPPLSAPE